MNQQVSHPFSGQKCYIATKHKKEQILSPLLSEVGLICTVAEIDTDQFGTFSGEVERKGTVIETLRKKIQKAASLYPDSQIILASEGTFGPHPQLGFIQSDLESLLLWHRELNIEIYAEHVALCPVHAEKVFGPRDDFRAFLKEINFPEHGVIVHPENLMTPIFKGLHKERAVAQAMLDCFMAGKTGKVVVSTDLRSMHNPTRQTVIRQSCKKLVEKLKSFCPECGLPGFSISEGIPGLPCSNCELPTEVVKSVRLSCVKCSFSETKTRPDGKIFADPGECPFCNP